MTTGVDTQRIRVATWNLRDGGIDDCDDSRLREQIRILAGQKLDWLGLQEAKWGTRHSRLLHSIAEQLGMTFRCRIPSNHHGCDLVMMVRERGGMRVVEERHDTSNSWWHAQGNLRVLVPGYGIVDFLNSHFAASSRTRRTMEGEAYGLFKGRKTVAVGDYNAKAATCDDPDPTGIDQAHARSKLHTGAAQAIEDAGFIDVAALSVPGDKRPDPTPTVGHTRADRLNFRADRIYFNRLPVRTARYQVIPAVLNPGTPQERALSDHHLVVADLYLSAETEKAGKEPR